MPELKNEDIFDYIQLLASHMKDLRSLIPLAFKITSDLIFDAAMYLRLHILDDTLSISRSELIVCYYNFLVSYAKDDEIRYPRLFGQGDETLL